MWFIGFAMAIGFTASLDIKIMHLNKIALFGCYFNGVMIALYSYLQWTELQWQVTHNTLVFRLFGYTEVHWSLGTLYLVPQQILHLVSLNQVQCKMEWKENTRIIWFTDDHGVLLKIWNMDTNLSRTSGTFDASILALGTISYVPLLGYLLHIVYVIWRREHVIFTCIYVWTWAFIYNKFQSIILMVTMVLTFYLIPVLQFIVPQQRHTFCLEASIRSVSRIEPYDGIWPFISKIRVGEKEMETKISILQVLRVNGMG